jgi:hypothetical protein
MTEVLMMMKKIFALVMVLGVLGAFLAGCSKPADDTSATAGTTAGATAGTTAGATAGSTTGK